MANFKRKTDGAIVQAFLLEVPVSICAGLNPELIEYIPGDWLMVAPGRFPNSLYFVKDELFRKSCDPVDDEGRQMFDHRVPLIIDENRPFLRADEMEFGVEYLVVCQRVAQMTPPEACYGVFRRRQDGMTTLVDGDQVYKIPTDKIDYATPTKVKPCSSSQ